MDETNPNAENAIDGAISFAAKNNIGEVRVKEIVRVSDEEAFKTIDKGDNKIVLFKSIIVIVTSMWDT